MKKIVSVLLLFAMLFYTLPVLASEEVTENDIVTEEIDYNSINAVMEKIDAIGEVTIHAGNKIKDARDAYEELPDSHKELVENIAILTDAEAAIAVLYEELANIDYLSVYEATAEYISQLGTPNVGSVGGEWMVIALTRSGRECPEGYYENVVTFVNENINDKGQLHRAKSTENSRVILALTSLGYDVTNVDGHNLLCGLSDMNYLKRQGVNGPIWALIALDSYGYEIPQNSNEDTQATREEIISYIMEKQLPDGGWSIYGQTSDPDMTGMAIVALAPYCDTNPQVAEAVETALSYLSEVQYENGAFGSIEGICSESCAQVIVALTALGIDPETDERFIKNGISVVDALCMFAVEGGGFEHIPYIGLNGMATEQGEYALVSYIRFLEGATHLYDMSDVTITQDEDQEENEDWDDAIEEEDPEIWEDPIVEEDPEIWEDPIVEDDLDPETEDPLSAENNPTQPATEQTTSENTEIFVMTDTTFPDVQKNDWYYESVKYAYENNLMQGTDNGFEPNTKMTRAMLVTTLYRMQPTEVTEAIHNFSDVSKDSWYADAVFWAVTNKIVNGVSETEFMPDQEVTREQMALMLLRYAKMQGMDVSGSSNLEIYADKNEISDWATEAIQWANAALLLTGTDGATLSPKGTATRAQVATVLMRFSQMSVN
ncbi:MAG: S-layer homology domain-containing protein [Clostridia bacterium]|nr:S-layer homology domain-containing protein [Clostridia bacterium]